MMPKDFVAVFLSLFIVFCSFKIKKILLYIYMSRTSQLLRCITATGSSAGLSRVSPTEVEARKLVSGEKHSTEPIL